MKERISSSNAILEIRGGPLSSCIDAYSTLLIAQGFGRCSVHRQIRLVLDFSRWLDHNGYGIRDVSPDRVARYFEYRYQQLPPQRGDSAALDRLIQILRPMGVIADPSETVVCNACEGTLNAFRTHLSHERGLSPATLKNYIPFARRLLIERFAETRIEVSQLCATDITGFVRRHAELSSRKRALLMTTALRSFLRFLYKRGDIMAELAACVPTVPSWSLSDIPKSIQPSEVQSILDHCDRETPVGRRDYAILLLLARLGLRASEVAFLRLDDVDWKDGHIAVQGKGDRPALLPLPVEVGEALADYVQNGRPRCSSRSVFIRSAAPRIGFATHTAISTIVRRAMARAKVRSPHKGAHLLRHSLATRMLQQGATLTEIGEILRHRDPNTTVLYAKVDLKGLRTIALPWPGGER